MEEATDDASSGVIATDGSPWRMPQSAEADGSKYPLRIVHVQSLPKGGTNQGNGAALQAEPIAQQNERKEELVSGVNCDKKEDDKKEDDSAGDDKKGQPGDDPSRVEPSVDKKVENVNTESSAKQKSEGNASGVDAKYESGAHPFRPKPRVAKKVENGSPVVAAPQKSGVKSTESDAKGQLGGLPFRPKPRVEKKAENEDCEAHPVQNSSPKLEDQEDPEMKVEEERKYVAPVVERETNVMTSSGDVKEASARKDAGEKEIRKEDAKPKPQKKDEKAQSKEYVLPGSRSWSIDRTANLLTRAADAGVKGIDPSDPITIEDARLMKTAWRWTTAVSDKRQGIKPEDIRMCGPVPDVKDRSHWRPVRFVNWNMPKSCDVRLPAAEPEWDFDFLVGDLRKLGFPTEAETAWDTRPIALKTAETFHLQWLRVSTLQAVAVEELLKTMHDRLQGTEHYSALTQPIKDVADLTALQCNRSAMAAYSMCRQLRRMVVRTTKIPPALENQYVNRPFSTILFEGERDYRAPFSAMRGNQTTGVSDHTKRARSRSHDRHSRRRERSGSRRSRSSGRTPRKVRGDDRSEERFRRSPSSTRKRRRSYSRGESERLEDGHHRGESQRRSDSKHDRSFKAEGDYSPEEQDYSSPKKTGSRDYGHLDGEDCYTDARRRSSSFSDGENAYHSNKSRPVSRMIESRNERYSDHGHAHGHSGRDRQFSGHSDYDHSVPSTSYQTTRRSGGDDEDFNSGNKGMKRGRREDVADRSHEHRSRHDGRVSSRSDGEEGFGNSSRGMKRGRREDIDERVHQQHHGRRRERSKHYEDGNERPLSDHGSSRHHNENHDANNRSSSNHGSSSRNGPECLRGSPSKRPRKDFPNNPSITPTKCQCCREGSHGRQSHSGRYSRADDSSYEQSEEEPSNVLEAIVKVARSASERESRRGSNEGGRPSKKENNAHILEELARLIAANKK